MSVKKEILIPVLLSIVSAIIFWFTFSYMPNRKRVHKIQPKINQDLYIVSENLYRIFHLIMSEKKNSQTCYFTKQILSGNLTKDEINLGLQNKCSNASSLKYAQINPYMVIIGEDLYSRTSIIINKINDLYVFSEFLSADQIILLEKIKKTIQAVDFSGYKEDQIELVSNLTRLSENFNVLYYLYCRLLPMVFDNRHDFVKTSIYFDIGFPLAEISYHMYFTQNYRKCRRCIKKALKYSQENVFELSLIRCEYLLGRKRRAFSNLKTYLSQNNLELLYISNFIEEITQYDSEIMEWIEVNYSEEEVLKLKSKMETNKKKQYADKMKFIYMNENIDKFFEKITS
ncbi:hypothetical protein [Maribellus sediminis]|uniref:hypothetical protein n=1 Tax=Maribellus sediminis TaxID=2696285 RepID=UPI001430D7F2|nr:hypothetical protein [Maribellus sediminis]